MEEQRSNLFHGGCEMLPWGLAKKLRLIETCLQIFRAFGGWLPSDRTL